LPERPDFSVPRFILCIAWPTVWDDLRLYFLFVDFGIDHLIESDRYSDHATVSRNQGDQEQHDKNEEQDFRDSCRRAGDPKESQAARYQSDYQKYQRPIKHG
jgi:hypothetical protein